MTPKEKAEEIFNRCLLYINAENSIALTIATKGCAGVCVDEIMKDAEKNWNVDDKNYEHSSHYNYWNAVMEEIQKL